MEKHPAFQYQPLSGRKIRILHLAPGQPGDEFVGDLLIGDLNDENCEYDALSYMWGSPEPTATIRIGHQVLPIARNLTEALQRLRYPDKTLVIWIDAICINQNDDVEKATQVPLMRRLYSNANIVRIWINELLDVPPEVITALQNFQHTEDPNNCYGLGVDPTFYETILPLFFNPYWSRVWVQQEVFNAKEMAIHCVNSNFKGRNILEFYHSVNESIDYLFRYQPVESSRWLKYFNIQSSSAGKLLKQKHRALKRSLFWVLMEYSESGLKSSRECDHLYALMHMANDYEEGAIRVNYSKSRLEVMLDAAEYHVRRNKDVQFLYFVQMTTDLDRPYNRMFPTWIPPSWLLGKIPVSVFLSSHEKFLWGSRQPSASICMNSGRLNLFGLRIDYISQCLTPDWNYAKVTVGHFWESPFGAVLQSTRSSEVTAEIVGLFESAYSDDPSVEVLLEALALLKALAEKAPHTLLSFEDLSPVICRESDPSYPPVIYEIISNILTHRMVKTASGKLCKIPKCDFEVGDEIWVVLGCPVCVVLRPQPDGTYWHICPAVIPKWQEFEAFKNFTESSKPGDNIGDWTVEEIQIS